MPSTFRATRILDRLDHLVGLVVGVQNYQVHAELRGPRLQEAYILVPELRIEGRHDDADGRLVRSHRCGRKAQYRRRGYGRFDSRQSRHVSFPL